MKRQKIENNKKQKPDPMKIFTRIMAALLIIMMLAGTFYTIIYLLING